MPRSEDTTPEPPSPDPDDDHDRWLTERTAAIVAYINRKTAEIDALIDAIESLPEVKVTHADDA